MTTHHDSARSARSTQRADTPGLSRRTVLGGILGAGAAGVGMFSAAGAAATPAGVAVGGDVSPSAIQPFPTIDDAPTVYEVNGNPTSFSYETAFHSRLGSWLQFWEANTPGSFGRQFELWSYGAFTDHRPSQAHNSGRGFDLSRIYVRDSGGQLVEQFSARWDLWQGDPDEAVKQRRYWATSASAHHHFRHVITYPYDPSGHGNHIHLDNLVSGAGNSTFSTGSSAQVYHVQGVTRHVWGLGTAVDGVWGPQTTDHSTRVLRAAGIASGSLTTSQANWLAFNRHSVRRGYDTQTYPQP